MLDEFLVSKRVAIIARTRARVASRMTPKPTEVELTNGIPVFLDQLGDALRVARSTNVVDHEQIAASAGRHGLDLFRSGLTIGQVVHDYVDVCQVVTELAVEEKAPISGEDFRTLNLCLDDAIPGAVAAYSHQRELAIVDQGTERLGVLSHELRNNLTAAASRRSATRMFSTRSVPAWRRTSASDRSTRRCRFISVVLAFEPIKSGRVAVAGSMGSLLGREFTPRAGAVSLTVSGVGLGLSICVKAAKAHGGEIHIRDIPGKGCVFTLELPRKSTRPTSTGDRKKDSLARRKPR